MKKSLQIIIISTLIFGLLTSGFAADNHQHTDGEKHYAGSPANMKNHDDHSDHDEHDEHENHDHENPDKHDEPAVPQKQSAAESGHNHEHEEGDAGVKLSATQLETAAINVAVIKARVLTAEIYTPGELKANDYTSYMVSPRIDSIVSKRHVALGDHIEKGEPLVTLFAAAVADAQAQYLIVRAEWRRAQKLGRKTVGAKRYLRAEMDYKAASSRLKIFGLNETAIKNTASSAATLGEYTLQANISGTVLEDDFQQGQRVAAGDTLLRLADEHNLWVEAYLAPNLNLDLDANTQARIKVNNRFYPATVSQQEHTIDPQSRTQTVRLLVENENHKLRPGMFVDVYFSIPSRKPILAVPETALMRGSDGDWTVFIEEETGTYQAHEIERGRTFGNLQEITGITPGSRVVVTGAFFLASQQAKGGFDPHNP